MTHLNDISKVYLEQVVESAVPGKPAEKLGAVTAIPKDEQAAAKERLLAKAKAKREMRPGSPIAQALKTDKKIMDLHKEEVVDEAVKGADTEMRKAASAERREGDKRLAPSKGKGYADQQKQSIAYMDKVTKKNKNVVGLVTKEALDPVGQEDADIDNDGDTDKSDKYLHKRRKAIGKAIAKKKGMKESSHYDPMDDDDFDHDEAEENRGVSGKNNPKGGKALGKKKNNMKEGFSNWREDLAEVMHSVDDSKKIKEKKINNKIKINPSLGEAVENIGGTLLEMVEIDEVDFIVENVYGELLEEGYEEDDIQEAIEYALTEAKVTFGHDTPTGEKKRKNLIGAVGRLARQKLSSKVRDVKKSAKQAVATGARKVAKKALGVARKMEGGDSTPSAAHTKTRKSSTYRGAGVGTKEKVSSGSYTPPTKKKAEKPADPWEGSATTPSKAKPKAKTKNPAAPKAKAPSKKKKSSNLDNLLASIRNEETSIERIDRINKEKVAARAATTKAEKQKREKSAAEFQAHKKEVLAKGGRPVDALDSWQKMKKEEVQIDEKTLTKMEMKKREEIVKSMKDKKADFEKRYPGRGEEVMYATATKMAKKMAEQMDVEKSSLDKENEKMDKQKLSNLKMMQVKKHQLERKKLQMQKMGKLPLETN